MAAANAWSVSRNASALLPARRQRLQVRRHRGAVHEEAQPQHEAGEHDDGERRVGRDQLRGEDLRGAGEDDGAHAERREPVGAGRRRADAADEPERQQADARGQHLDEALAEVLRSDEVAHGTEKGEAAPPLVPAIIATARRGGRRCAIAARDRVNIRAMNRIARSLWISHGARARRRPCSSGASRAGFPDAPGAHRRAVLARRRGRRADAHDRAGARQALGPAGRRREQARRGRDDRQRDRREGGARRLHAAARVADQRDQRDAVHEARRSIRSRTSRRSR